MTKYGFGGGIELPNTSTPDKPRPKAAAENVAKAVKAGADQGFVSREPAARRKPGPKRREPQGKMTIAGPDRIVQAFRAFCDARDLTLCEGVEYLLEVERDREKQ